MSPSEQMKSKAILLSGPLPVVHFKIPSVICCVGPWKSTANKQERAGDLIFTDKGIVFVHLAVFTPPSRAIVMAFGLIGSLITGKMHEDRREKALSEARIQRIGASDLQQTIEKGVEGVDFLFIPRGTISNFRYTLLRGFQVDTDGKSQQFLLEKRKKTYKEYQSQIEKYLAK